MELVRQKNVATIITFPLIDADGDAVTGSGNPDSEIDTWSDGAAPDGFADCTNEATEIGATGAYYLSLTQAECNVDYAVIQIKSDDAKTQWILIRFMVGDPLNLATTGDGSSITAASGIVESNVKEISDDSAAADNLELAADNYSATRGLSGTALPAAAADGVGGLPISDAGGLDLDTQLANTNEITAARMGALTDWINGGRLDLILDIIAADVVNIDGSSIPTAANIVDEWETQSQSDPTGFHVNVREWLDVAVTLSDNNNPDINVDEISDDPTAAVNLESQYDTTGLAGGTFPATQDQIGGIANVGAAVNVSAASYTLTTGTQSSGTVASTAALDGTNHEHTDDAGVMDLYYEFELGSGVPTSFTMTGYLLGINDDLEVHGWDWVASAWVQIGTLGGQALAGNAVNSYNAFVNMAGTGANLGKARIRFTDGAFTLTTATLAVDQVFASFSRGSEGYENGAIWVDTNASNTNTVVGVDGVARNPVSTWAAALTLSAATNLTRFQLASGSSITLTGNSDNYEMRGPEWTLVLGGQSIASALFVGAHVTGTGTGTESIFLKCELDFGGGGDFTIDEDAHLFGCGLAGDLTLSGAGDYHIDACFSQRAGSNPSIDFGAVGNQQLHIHHYDGGLEIKRMGDTGTDTMGLGGHGSLVLNANCDPSNSPVINIRGHFDITDNVAGGFVSGGGTINDDARYDVAQINAEADTALVDYDGPTNAEMLAAHSTTDGLIGTAQADLDTITGGNGVFIDDNAITAAKYDESTAFPVKADDAGATQIARVGADSDTLETLSDQIDALQTDIGDFSGRTNDQSLLDVLGVPDVAGKDLHTLLVTDRLDNGSFGLAQLVRSTTPGNTLDVSATGEAGLDFDNIKDATGAHTLTNITVPITTAVTNRVTANTDQIEGADATDTLDTSAQTGAQAALVANNLDHLMKTAVGNNADMTTEVTDGTVLSNVMSKTSDTSTFVVADESLEAIRDRGDTAWITAVGFNTVVPDAAGTAAGLHSTTDGKIDALQADIGDFSGRTNDQSLLDVLGVPDVAGKDLHTLLVTDRLDDGTFGLSAIRTRGDAEWITATGFNTTTPPTVGEIQAEMEEDGASILDTLRDRLTAARAGYLDELNAPNIPADIDTLLTRITGLIATKAEMDTAHGLLGTEAKQDTIITATGLLPEGPQKNTALNDLTFLMVDETDHATPEIGLTVTGQVSKDAGAFGAIAGSISEISNGIYAIDATAADMNADLLTFRFSATGADDTFITIKTTS